MTKNFFRFFLLFNSLVLLGITEYALPGLAAEPNPPVGSESVLVRVGEGAKQQGLAVGDVVGQGQWVDDECVVPRLEIELSGPVSSVAVGVEPKTCNVVVLEIITDARWEDFLDPDNLERLRDSVRDSPYQSRSSPG